MVSTPSEQVGSVALADVQSEHFQQQRLRKHLFIALGALTLVFGKVLFDLFQYAAKTELYSHIILIPVISAYLIWIDKKQTANLSRKWSLSAAALAFVGLGTMACYFALVQKGVTFSQNDYLTFSAAAYVLLLFATLLFFGGVAFFKSILFPVVFLVFLIPFPEKVTDALEIASQYASAETYSWMMNLTGAVHFREGLIFSLPGLTIRVAQECSGIRSSFVLFITSLIAGQMFLRSPWRKALLAFFVFPLGIARNAFRIYVISMLSSHWDPRIIHGPLHHHGGPIFFVLSLVPFFAFLIYLRNKELAKGAKARP